MLYNTIDSTISGGIEKNHASKSKPENNGQKGKKDQGDPRFEKNLISGIISLILLAITEKSTEPLYGYKIWKEMEAREKGKISLKQGTIYPVLRSLQKEGFLKSEIRASQSGPARKYYWITTKGKATLVIWKESWRDTRDFVETILGGETHE